MNSPSTRKRGNVGETAVRLKLESHPFWWDIMDNSRNDRGVDLLALVDDPLLGIREVPVAIQVKSGKSKFNRPKKQADGEVEGWWYYEPSKKHFDYWLECDVPVLLVLHNEEQDTSYWAHVTEGTVESTGKGAKILVERHKTISEECRDQLLRVAVRQSASLALEGTVLSDGLEEIPHERRLRYALVVPRLSSPHPSMALEQPIDAYEAVALLAQGNFRELDRIAEQHEEVPHPDAVPPGASWVWQVVGAIWNWLETNTTGRLETVYASAPDRHSATSSGVLLACALWRQERRSDAMTLLEDLAQRDDPDALDLAWVLVQRGRFHADLGNYDRAQSDVAAARRLLETVHDDFKVSEPMVTALSAGAARTSHIITATRRFRNGSVDTESTEAWIARQQESYLELLKASDTTVSWWRSQDVALALGREQDSRFDSWAKDDPAQHISGSPIPETRLLSAELNADLTGEHGHWKAYSGRRGIQCLMRAASFADAAAELEEGLDALRRCGDSNRFTRAIRHLVKVGPVAPIATSMAKIPTSGWTHTTAKTNFEALALAGDLLEQSAADRLLEQCARAACGETTDLGCTQDEGFFSLPSFATEAAAGVLPAASIGSHDDFAGYLSRLPEVPPVVFLRGLEMALLFLDYEQVGPTNRRALLSLVERGNAELSAAVWGWSGTHGDTAALRSLAQAAAQGEIPALAEIRDVSVLDEAQSTALIEVLDQRVDQARIDALAGSGRSDNSAYCHALTRLNLKIPSAARWDSVVAFLGETRTFIEEKGAICRALAADAELIPDDVRDQLSAVVDLVVSESPSFWPGVEAAGMELRLRIALGLIGSTEFEDAVTQLALGSHQEREDACWILRSSGCANRQLLLRILARDTDFTVRYRAAQTAAYLVATEASDSDIDLAWELARDTGRQIPIAVLRGFGEATNPLRSAVAEIATSLEQHPSAAVRHHVSRVLRREGSPSS